MEINELAGEIMLWFHREYEDKVTADEACAAMGIAIQSLIATQYPGRLAQQAEKFIAAFRATMPSDVRAN